jgi:hypothetical protein
VQTLRLAVWIHVLLLVVVVSGFTPPLAAIAMFPLLTIFLPQFLVIHILQGFSSEVGSIGAIAAFTIVTYVLAFPFSYLYASLARRLARHVRRSRHLHRESRASI